MEGTAVGQFHGDSPKVALLGRVWNAFEQPTPALLAPGLEFPVFETEPFARPELEARLLDSVRKKRLTQVVAPAGSGKTMALARLFELARDAGYLTLWYGCEPVNRDAARFLGKLRRLLGGPAQDEDMATVENVIERLRAVGEPILLLLDNFDHCESPEVDYALLRLIELGGGWLRVVLSARSSPQLEVSALRMRSTLGEFSRRDLAATAGEVGRFIGVADWQLDASTRDAIIAHTDGWLAAIQFVRLLIEDGVGCDRIEATLGEADENIWNYLDEEVFRSLSPSLQSFLLSIADLDRISPELGCAILQQESAVTAFDELLARDLFLIPLDRGRRWVRLHPIFRTYLVKRARRGRHLDLRNELMAAATWHWNRYDWREAVSYAIDAGEPEIAEKWLRSCSEHVILDLGEVPAFRAMCERLVETHELSSDLVIWMVWAAALSMSWVDAHRLLRRHAETLENAEGCSQRVLLVRSLITFAAHDFEKTIEQGCAWWDMALESTAFDRATVAELLAVSYRTQLNLKKAKIWRDRARNEIAHAAGSYGAVWGHSMSAYLSIVEGRPLEARNEIEDALAHHGRSEVSRSTIEPLLAPVYYELNQIDKVHEALDRFLVGSCGVWEIAFWAHATRVQIELKNVGPVQALALLDDGTSRLHSRYGQRWGVMCQILKREILSQLPNDQRRELVSQFSSAMDMTEGAGSSPDLEEWRQIIVARELIGEGRAREAIESIKGIVLSANNDGRLRSWIQASLIKAAAQRAQGDTRKGERTLIECLGRAAPLGLRRIILDESLLLRPFGAFLQKYETSVPATEPALGELVGLLLAELHISSKAGQRERDHSLVEALTKQEARIIGLLAEGLRNAEICERLVLSESTVKWHIYNIFQKFDVRSRTAAVREARLIGLVD